MTLRNDNNTDTYNQALSALLVEFSDLSKYIEGSELLDNLGLFVTPKERRREFFWYEVYRLLEGHPGSIGQFGVRWGRELALFDSLRSIFEPYNHSRKILAFDTFSGYTSITENDGEAKQIVEGNLSTFGGYANRLRKLLEIRQELSVNPHIQKFELFEGPVDETLQTFLDNNPEIVFSLVHLDFNLYQPTKYVLERLSTHTIKGTIFVFDELCCPALPGETIAFKEFNDRFRLEPIYLGWHKPIWPMAFRVQ